MKAANFLGCIPEDIVTDVGELVGEKCGGKEEREGEGEGERGREQSDKERKMP